MKKIKSPRLLSFVHPNTGKPLAMLKHTIAGWYWQESHKTNMLVLIAGGLVPVKETMEEINTIYFEGEKDE